MQSEYQSAIRELLGVPGTRGLYILGCFDQRVTVCSQQVRALNLVAALQEEIENSEVIVIGAGAAGITAAAAAAVLGAKVTVLERSDVPLALWRHNEQRYLHPHIYEWPREGSKNPNADIPLMDWTAGPAKTVARTLELQWEFYRDKFDITPEYGVERVSIRFEDGIRVSWNNQFKHPQIVICAVGFGQEHRINGTTRYWENDNVQAANGDIVVSGCGDGALIDILRAALVDFSHDKMLTDLVSEIEPLEAQLLAIEEGLHAGSDTNADRVLSQAYRELGQSTDAAVRRCLDVVDDRLRLRLKTNTQITMRVSAYPLQRNSSILNRLLVSRLIWSLNKVTVHDHKVDPSLIVPPTNDIHLWRIPTDDPISPYQECSLFIPRWGVERPVPLQRFPEIWRATTDLRTAWAALPMTLRDVTRSPRYGNIFDDPIAALGNVSALNAGSQAAHAFIQSTAVTIDINTLPHWDTSLYIDCKNVLATIRTSVAAKRHVIISGDPGVGKTLSAVRFAETDAMDFRHKIWLRAAGVESIHESLLRQEVITGLGFDIRGEIVDASTFVQQIVRKLHQEHDPYLMIFDGVEDLADIEYFLPPPASRGVAIVTTTLDSLSQQLGDGWDDLILDTGFNDPQGALFLLRRGKIIAATDELISASASDIELATKISRAVQGYPLALEDLAGLLVGNRSKFSLRRIADDTNHLFQSSTLNPTRHESARATFFNSYTSLSEHNPKAAEILQLACWIDGTEIPLELFEADTESPKGYGWDRTVLFTAITDCAAFCLIRFCDPPGTLTIHPFRQSLLRSYLRECGEFQSAKKVAELLAAHMPLVTSLDWQTYRLLSPHLDSVCSNTQIADNIGIPVDLLCNAAKFSAYEGNYDRGLSLLDRASAENIHSPDASSELLITCTKASLFVSRGKYEDALALLEHEPDFADNPDAWITYTSVKADALLHRGRLDESAVLYQSVLDKYKRGEWPESDISEALCLGNIALLRKLQGNHTLAKQLYEQARNKLHSLRPQSKCDQHYAVITGNLAALLRDDGELAAADALYVEAIEILERVLGHEHPMLATLLTSRGIVYEKMGLFSESRRLHHRAISILEQTFGPNHHLIASVLNNLSLVLEDDVLSEQALERAIEISADGVFGKGESLYNLAVRKMKHQNIAEAITLSERAAAIFEATRGINNKYFRDAILLYVTTCGRGAFRDLQLGDMEQYSHRLAVAKVTYEKYRSAFDIENREMVESLLGALDAAIEHKRGRAATRGTFD